MSSTRNIKQRIANVSSVEQIIKAMDMVSSTKLHKARAQLNGVRPIYYELKRIIEELGATAQSHIFFKGHEVKSSLYIVLTGDRGLCGSYNTNIASKALEHMNQGKNEKIIIVGSKGSEYFRKKNKNILNSYTDVDDSQVYYASEKVAKRLIEVYLSGEVDEVFIAYTHFETALSYVPTVERLLPLTTGSVNDLLYSNDEKYEPDVNTFIDHVVPLYLHMNLFRTYSESHTSEQAARMVSMDAAGKNASDLIGELNHMYNRKRQAGITQELSEIVGSVNVLNKGGIDES